MEGASDTYWDRLRTCRAARSFQSVLGTEEDLVPGDSSHIGRLKAWEAPSQTLEWLRCIKNGTRPEERREPQALKGALLVGGGGRLYPMEGSSESGRRPNVKGCLGSWKGSGNSTHVVRLGHQRAFQILDSIGTSETGTHPKDWMVLQ